LAEATKRLRAKFRILGDHHGDRESPKELRESKQLSQGDIEKRTGLLRCYISRVENGHTVPAIETLEEMARALEVPMYRLFHEGEAATRSLETISSSEPGLNL